MKTSFPLFARLLIWSSINLVVLLLALFLTLRFQFGPQFGGFLPDNSHEQTQAMAVVLIDDLAKTPREKWDEVLSHLDAAYHMEFALYDGEGQRVAGTAFELPPAVHTVVVMAKRLPRPGQPEGGFAPPGEGMFPPPPQSDPADLPPGAPPPRAGQARILPDFPQRVERTDDPRMFWLMVHLPLDRLQVADMTPLMLIGRTPSIEGNPLLFNPSPWIYLAVGMVVFSAFFWVPLTRNLTRAIAQMTQTTEAIAEGRFDVEASEKRSDELGRLGLAINRMASRLKGFITGQRRFLGDVAHELCSPLARMEVALAILEERADEKAAPYVRDVREEVTHMRKLAHELLSFSKASLGEENRIKLETVRVADVVAQAVRQEHCEAGRVEIQVPEGLSVQANPELLCRAVANLLRNAIHYAGHAGPVAIRAWEEAGAVMIVVADQGPGVPGKELEKLFDPFYRIDESRTSETGGVGLGLAIVKTCVEACRGTVTAFNQDGGGLAVQLRFPK